jgi:hypothetical protein
VKTGVRWENQFRWDTILTFIFIDSISIRAASWRRIVMGQRGGHSRKSSFSGELCLKKIDQLVFELSGNKQTDHYAIDSAQIYRYRAASRRRIVMKQRGGHTRESSFSGKLRLNKIDRLVFELSGNKQTDKNSKN